MDGLYGRATDVALREYQTDAGLEPNGKLNLDTLASLKSAGSQQESVAVDQIEDPEPIRTGSVGEGGEEQEHPNEDTVLEPDEKINHEGLTSSKAEESVQRNVADELKERPESIQATSRQVADEPLVAADEHPDGCQKKYIEIKRGQTNCGISLDNNGSILTNGRQIGKQFTKITEPTKIQLLPASPDGKSRVMAICTLVKGVEMCASPYVYTSGEDVKGINVAARGGLLKKWILWAPDSRFAVVSETIRGEDWALMIHVKDGWNTFIYPGVFIDFANAGWVNNATFKMPVKYCGSRAQIGDEAKCQEFETPPKFEDLIVTIKNDKVRSIQFPPHVLAIMKQQRSALDKQASVEKLQHRKLPFEILSIGIRRLTTA